MYYGYLLDYSLEPIYHLSLLANIYICIEVIIRKNIGNPSPTIKPLFE